MNRGRSLLLPCLLLLLTACTDRPPSIDHALRELMPATRVEGRTYAPSSVEQRMNEHHVPAVSIAVIDDGRIVWARAYGLADVEEKWKATPHTLFQAASKVPSLTTLVRLAVALDYKVTALLTK